MKNKILSLIKIIVPIASIMVVVLGSAVGFAINISSRLSALEKNQNISTRVENLEDALMPVLIEYKLKQQLDAILSDMRNEHVDHLHPEPMPSLPSPIQPPPEPMASSGPRENYLPLDYDKLQDEAEEWAREQFAIPPEELEDN